MKKISNRIKDADAILIGASNGLSITEGIHLFANNQAMHDLFGDLQQKYGLQNILHGMMVRWPSEEEKWGFWSRLINYYCGSYKPAQVMKDLKAIVGDKDYFVVTSNGEQHFEMSGFAEDKIYEVEGDWLHMTCVNHCHDTVYPSYELSLQMAEKEKNGKIPSDMVPKCPKCGGNMQPYMADTAVRHNPEASRRFSQFLEHYHGKNIVILELGIGARNQLIKAPLMRLTAQEPNATYVTINLGELYIADDIRDKSFGLDGYLSEILGELKCVCEE